MVTIRDIAQECGVSIATVSNVLNNKKNVSEEMRARVLAKVRELNYTPNTIAKNLKTKRTHTLGIIVEDILVFSAPAVIDGITAYCAANGYGLSLVNLRLLQTLGNSYYFQPVNQDQLQDVLNHLMADQVEAIVYIAAHARQLPCLPTSFPIPLVMCCAYSATPGIPSVLVDEVQCTEELIRHALSLGHRRIGVISGKNGSAQAQAHLRAYQNVLYQSGVLFDPSLICQGDWQRESGYQFTDYLLEKGATLIFCMNDLMAGGVYDRLYELGQRVPEDISVIGHGNLPMSNFLRPPLTTVSLPLHDLGRRAAEIALSRPAEDDAPPQAETYLAGTVVLRGSVGPAQSKPA